MKGKGDTESDPGHSVELNYVMSGPSGLPVVASDY